MNQLEDLLRDAYGQERFTMAVPEIEARARKARRRRTTVTLAFAGGLAVATILTYVLIPRPPEEPPVTWPNPSVAVTESAAPVPPVSPVNRCRESLTRQGGSTLLSLAPVQVAGDGEAAYIFSDGNSTFICQIKGAGLNSTLVEPVKGVTTPLSQMTPQYSAMTDEGRQLVVGPVPHGMQRFDYFNDAGITQLGSNGKVVYGYAPEPKNPMFGGMKGSAGEVFTAMAVHWMSDAATTPAAQRAACRATQLRMPVPDIELASLGRREVDDKTSVLLLGAGGLLAVCKVTDRQGTADITITIANHPIYQTLSSRLSVVLMQQSPEHSGRARAVFSDGSKAPLAFGKGYATAWLDRPDDVHADHLEIDLRTGGHIVYP